MKKLVTSMICAGVLAANCLSVVAQSPQVRRQAPAPAPPRADQDVVFETRAMPGGATFNFVSAEGAFGGKTVKGAPYSAQAVTEELQVLSDGNRIVRKNSSSVYRDSEGRTRQEQTLRSIGPYAAVAGEAPQTVSIFDPVDGAHYMLDVNSKTAHKIGIVKFDNPAMKDVTVVQGGAIRTVPAGEAVFVTRADVVTPQDQEKLARANAEIAAVKAERGTMVVSPDMGGHQMTYLRTSKENVKSESLGTQMVEGVSAEGTRTTFTIPAGEIGNEQPINVVTEVWFSSELQVVVMRKHTDPRQGESTYRLTNINRAEPARSLFEVPADYTLKESPADFKKVMVERELQRARKVKEQEEKQM